MESTAFQTDQLLLITQQSTSFLRTFNLVLVVIIKKIYLKADSLQFYKSF